MSFRQFPDQHFIQTVCYDHSGDLAGEAPYTVFNVNLFRPLSIGVGLTSGQVYILDAITLQDIHDGAVFHYSKNSISHIAFSTDSDYMSTAVSRPTSTVIEYYTVLFPNRI